MKARAARLAALATTRACRGRARTGLRLAALAGAWLLAGASQAAEPTAESLWAMPAPPFCVLAPASAVSDKSALEPYSRGSGPALTRDIAEFMNLKQGGNIPRPLDPAGTDVANRTFALGKAASHAAAFYRTLFRAPQLHVQNGCFRVLLVGRDAAAAYYGRGLEATNGADDRFERWTLANEAGEVLPNYVFLSEQGVFDQDFNLVYPAKPGATVAHEIFHAIQARYPQPARDDVRKAWITEGLPDAIATRALRGHRFMHAPAYAFPENFRVGSIRYGKVLGLRPYDYPLDLSEVPSQLAIKPALGGRAEIRELMGYMSSGFWRYLFEDVASYGEEWVHLPGLMEQRGTGSSVREETLRWADRAASTAMPGFRGLYDAFPDFIAKRVAYPDREANSRQDVFAHPEWLQYMFQDGCPLATFGDGQAPYTVELDIRPMAARCLRLKWVGTRLPHSGAPSAQVTVTPMSTDTGLATQSIRMGHRGKADGQAGGYTDPASGARVRILGSVDLDPLPGARTGGEVVLTFTNVALDPVKTRRQKYLLRIVVNHSQVQGSLTRPAVPDGPPASTGKATGVRVQGNPSGTVGMAAEGVSIGTGDADAGSKEVLDCVLLAAEAMGSASPAALSLDQQADTPQERMDAVLQGSCRATLEGLATPAFWGRHRNVIGAMLHLPPVPSGTTGSVAGASVDANWYDPAQPDERRIAASTDLVAVSIAEATESYVRGGWSARFVADLHGADGQLSGDFTFARADAERPEFPVDAVDLMSTDALIAMHRAGVDVASAGAAARSGGGAASGPAQPPAGGGAAIAAHKVLDCYVEHAGEGAPAAQRAQLRSQLEAQLDGLDAASRAKVLELFRKTMQEEGATCRP